MRIGRCLATFLWAFLGLGTMIAAWSFATPISAGPDEPQHVIQAAALVRGQFDEPERVQTFIGKFAAVTVPSWAAQLANGPPCYAERPAISAACMKPLGDSTRLVSANTQFSNAPPLYYAIVGVPSLFAAGPAAVYTMRLVGGLVEAALVALGLALLDRYYPRRTVLIGVLFALTPMTVFLMSVVTSSGLETAAGFATWCAGLCVIENPRVPRALAVWTAVTAILLVLARPASPLDVIVIAVVLGFFVGWRGVRQRLNPSLRPLWIPVVCSILIAALFLAVGGLPQLLGIRSTHPASMSSNAWQVLRLTPHYLRETVGAFGWDDVRAPAWVVAVWIVGVTGLTLVAFARSVPCRRALPVLVLAVVLIPQVLETPQVNAVGTYFASRYLVPVAIGFPLVAATFPWRPPKPWMLPSVVGALGGLWIAAQTACFALTLARNETGLTGGPPPAVEWLPPAGTLPVELLLIVGGLVTVSLLTVRARDAGPSPTPPLSLQSDASFAARS